jgi:hypothetical protein
LSPFDESLWKEVVFFGEGLGGSFSLAFGSDGVDGTRDAEERAEEFFLGGFEAMIRCAGLYTIIVNSRYLQNV